MVLVMSALTWTIVNIHSQLAFPTGPPIIFVAAGYTYGAFRGGYADINT